jgi:hypothetical protein
MSGRVDGREAKLQARPLRQNARARHQSNDEIISAPPFLRWFAELRAFEELCSHCRLWSRAHRMMFSIGKAVERTRVSSALCCTVVVRNEMAAKYIFKFGFDVGLEGTRSVGPL